VSEELASAKPVLARASGWPGNHCLAIDTANCNQEPVMREGKSPQALNNISTLWTVVGQANHGSGEEVGAAQSELLQRYSRAIHRYLLGALHDPEAADELGQEFALRFLRGDFAKADPERGRFRDYVKGVLSKLIADHFRRRGKVRTMPQHAPEPAGADPAHDRDFIVNWRDELMKHAWDALAQAQEKTGKPFYTVLHFRSTHPHMHSQQMAEQLSLRLGTQVTAVWVRQTLHRARDRFIDLLVHLVLETMSQPTYDDLVEELGELGLLKYCEPVLKTLRFSS
jgi:RNA polymerase sigma-70 factor (ECF subfamily)